MKVVVFYFGSRKGGTYTLDLEGGARFLDETKGGKFHLSNLNLSAGRL